MSEDDAEDWPMPVATNLTRLRRDMRACGATEEEIARIVSYLPHLKPPRKPRPKPKITGKGKAFLFLQGLLGHQGDACVTWPFAKNPNGYGNLGYLGRQHWAHRLMCELAHGAAPTKDYECAHSCGKGHEGCVNPKHLEWKTQTENRRDSITHGTSQRKRGTKAAPLLSPEQVNGIRALKGKLTQDKIADRFGISPPMVRAIFTGKAYKSVGADMESS